jgi:hypothetical protein
VRRATLVPCLRVSWAGQGHAGPPEAARRPGGQGCEGARGVGALPWWVWETVSPRFWPLASPLASPRVPARLSGGGFGVPRRRRQSGDRSAGRACRCRPSQSPPGGINGLAGPVWRSPPPGNPTATQCGPGCDSAFAKYEPSVQQPHGDVVLRGATGESPTEGSGLSRGGTPGGHTGGQGAAKWCAGLDRPPDGGFSEGTDGRAGAPFAPLSCV